MNPIHTALVANINPTGNSSASLLTVFNDGVHGDKLYFLATDGSTNHGTELWSTDGTNTVMVKDINTTTNNQRAGLVSGSAQLTVFHNGLADARLFFVATYDGSTTFGSHGYELWSTSASGLSDTPGGTTDESMTTVEVQEINPVTNPGGALTPTNLTVLGNTLFFSASRRHGCRDARKRAVDDHSKRRCGYCGRADR